MPEYMKAISPSIHAAIEAAEQAAGEIEQSAEYNNHLHPFHRSAVAAYNALTTILLTLDRMEA